MSEELLQWHLRPNPKISIGVLQICSGRKNRSSGDATHNPPPVRLPWHVDREFGAKTPPVQRRPARGYYGWQKTPCPCNFRSIPLHIVSARESARSLRTGKALIVTPARWRRHTPIYTRLILGIYDFIVEDPRLQVVDRDVHSAAEPIPPSRLHRFLQSR